MTGVIDAVAFEADAYYVHGWACQEGNRGSIGVNIYANHAAGGKPPGAYVMAGTAKLDNEPAVDRECRDANGGKHRFRIALPNQLLRTFQGKKLFVHGIALAGNVENALLAGSGNFAFPAPKWPPNCGKGKGQKPCLVPDAACAIRTGNILDPSSWRGWDGKDFTVEFVDPYRRAVANPQAHVCALVPYLDYSTGINYHPASHLFVATLWNQGSASWGPQGVYFTTSPDFIHWSKPELAMTQNQMLRREPEGNWSYQYFSLIDPKSQDSSYMTITDNPYLYYVRMDNDHGPYRRVLFRQKIKLDWLAPLGQKSH